MRARRQAARGYTVVEVMVAISLLIVASSGIVALQKVTTQGNGHARELATASEIARTWIERLRTDATVWNVSPKTGLASDLSETLVLNGVDVKTPNSWFRPDFSALGSPGADIQGNDIPQAKLDDAFYCTHVRLSWMFPGEVIRADVRVIWQRPGGAGGFGNLGVCANNQTVANFSDPSKKPLSSYNFVYLSSSIVRNKGQIQ